MKRLVFLKLGGSLITDKSKPMEAKMDIIHMLASQIKAAIDEDKELQLIIGNGAGSFAHYAVITNNMQGGMDTDDKNIGYSKVQQAAAKLNKIVVDALIEVDLPAITVQPSSCIVGENGKIAHFPIHVLHEAITHNIVPVMYGDILLDKTKGSMIASTELLIAAAAEAFIAEGYPVHKVIHNGVTPGVLDNNGAVIPHITRENVDDVKKMIYDTAGFDVTGGMMHKIEESIMLLDKGVKTMIINGVSEKDLLKKALLDQKVAGTYFG